MKEDRMKVLGGRQGAAPPAPRYLAVVLAVVVSQPLLPGQARADAPNEADQRPGAGR